MLLTLKLEYPHKICGLIGNAVDEQRVKYKVHRTEQHSKISLMIMVIKVFLIVLVFNPT